MFGRAKVLAEWREPPRLTRRQADRVLKYWSLKSRAGFVLSPALLFAVIFYLISRVRGQPFTAFLPGIVEVLGASLLIVVALPWFMKHYPRCVRISRRGVAVLSGSTLTIPFREIRRATFSTRVVDGYRIRTLVIDTIRERHYELGIDSSITPAQIAQILAQQGVRIDPDVD